MVKYTAEYKCALKVAKEHHLQKGFRVKHHRIIQAIFKLVFTFSLSFGLLSSQSFAMYSPISAIFPFGKVVQGENAQSLEKPKPNLKMRRIAELSSIPIAIATSAILLLSSNNIVANDMDAYLNSQKSDESYSQLLDKKDQMIEILYEGSIDKENLLSIEEKIQLTNELIRINDSLIELSETDTFKSAQFKVKLLQFLSTSVSLIPFPLIILLELNHAGKHIKAMQEILDKYKKYNE